MTEVRVLNAVLLALFLILLIPQLHFPSRAEVVAGWAPLVESLTRGNNFARIDLNSDGLLTKDELDAALTSGKFTQSDCKVLQHMHKHISWLGHIISSHTSENTYFTMNPISDGQGGFYQTPQFHTEQTTIHIYAVSREDIATYKQRMCQ